ncbi:BnaC04g32190D [Brassica napus]|uniref:BnaC04g32190D protein n=1 Tax=Brassica napus TaxID=3708 RepID=A0A078HGE6_BRANA|nr:BnaC04g32190D [Brassica napus]
MGFPKACLLYQQPHTPAFNFILRLLDELTNLDAACASYRFTGNQNFYRTVEIMSQMYCPDIAEDRQDSDHRLFDPED